MLTHVLVMSARTHTSSVAWYISPEIIIWAGVPSDAEPMAWRIDNLIGQGGRGLSLAVSCTELQLKQEHWTAQPGLPQGLFSAVSEIG